MYGLAPTEIIYHIALSYILGFNEDTKDIKHNFRQLDALPYAKEGTLQQKLDELFKDIAQRRLNILSIELFNEINWVDFNGDLQTVEGGAIINENNYKDFPFMEKYIEGMEKYTQLVSILRRKIDSASTGGKQN